MWRLGTCCLFFVIAATAWSGVALTRSTADLKRSFQMPRSIPSVSQAFSYDFWFPPAPICCVCYAMPQAAVETETSPDFAESAVHRPVPTASFPNAPELFSQQTVSNGGKAQARLQSIEAREVDDSK